MCLEGTLGKVSIVNQQMQNHQWKTSNAKALTVTTVRQKSCLSETRRTKGGGGVGHIIGCEMTLDTHGEGRWYMAGSRQVEKATLDKGTNQCYTLSEGPHQVSWQLQM